MPLVFDSILYGSPNFPIEGGMRRYHKLEDRLLPEYYAMVSAVGLEYKERIKENFSAKHGRTGETADTMTDDFTIAPQGVEIAAQYRIQIAGGVDYVINPIRAHLIESADHALDNPQTGPFEGRTQNFYQPFPDPRIGVPLHSVLWTQDGPDGHGPDNSWWKDDTELIAEARAGFASLAARAEVYWGVDAETSEGFEVISYPARQGGSYTG